MKITHFAVAAAAAMVCHSGFAAGGPLDLSTGSTSFGSTPAAGSFTDLWTFTLSTASIVSGSITSVVSGTQDVDFTSIQITGGASPVSFSQLIADPVETWGLTSTTLAAGSYTLRLVGTNSATMGSYAGNLGVTAVPEPETYAMLAAGLVLIGMRLRRAQR